MLWIGCFAYERCACRLVVGYFRNYLTLRGAVQTCLKATEELKKTILLFCPIGFILFSKLNSYGVI